MRRPPMSKRHLIQRSRRKNVGSGPGSGCLVECAAILRIDAAALALSPYLIRLPAETIGDDAVILAFPFLEEPVVLLERCHRLRRAPAFLLGAILRALAPVDELGGVELVGRLVAQQRD